MVANTVNVQFTFKGNRPVTAASLTQEIRDRLFVELEVFSDRLKKAFERNGPNTRGMTGLFNRSWVGETPTVTQDLRFNVSIANTAPNSFYRALGRGPGGTPPYQSGSDLERWSRAMGLVPYVVAHNIARRGTRRWRGEDENVLGLIAPSSIRPDSTVVEVSFKPSSPVVIALGVLEDRWNKLVL